MMKKSKGWEDDIEESHPKLWLSSGMILFVLLFLLVLAIISNGCLAAPAPVATPVTYVSTVTAVLTATPQPTATPQTTATPQPTVTPVDVAGTVAAFVDIVVMRERPFMYISLFASFMSLLISFWLAWQFRSPHPALDVPSVLPHGLQSAMLVKQSTTRPDNRLQPVVFDADLPLDATRPPNERERELIRSLYRQTKSMNQTVKVLYGFKDGRTMGYARLAFTESRIM